MKTLVVYYTLSGNSKFAAEAIAAELGADLEEVIDLKKRQGKLAFLSNGRDAGQGKLTEIAPLKKNPTDYDLVIIGGPIWNKSPTPAIRTYLDKTNLSGKKVGFFLSDSAFGLSNALEKTRALTPNSTILDDLVLSGKGFGDKEETKKKIVEWVQKIKSTNA
ncbi:MAG TPA: flavodoxin [Candidatus Deferrimicrobiaceae bacterium]|nr:flavodoxin [Candidatus Deferrimicrobiaceae bacterium]